MSDCGLNRSSFYALSAADSAQVFAILLVTNVRSQKTLSFQEC
jgi:hypothetical protein